MAGTPLKNLRLFEQLCGKNAFKNVILTTTMWDEVDEETGATREAELKGIYWKDMISRSSTIGRFEGSRDSAFRLISPFLDEASTRNRVRLQKELVNLDLKLSETRAGQRLRSELKQLAKQQQELLHQTREELKLPNNTESLKTLMEEYEELKRTSGSLLAQMADLQIPLGRQFMKTITITFGIKRNRYVYKILISSTLIGTCVRPGKRRRILLSSRQRTMLPLPPRRTMLDNARQTNYCYKEFQQFVFFHFF